jgi:hypothetical protein
MRTTAVCLAAVLGLLLPSAAIAKDKDKEKAKPKAAQSLKTCIKFSQTGDSEKRTVTFRIDNDCKQDLECSISWEVKCVKQDSSDATSHDEHGFISSGAGSSFQASAAQCAAEDGYEISPPKWTCKTPSTDTASNK